MPNLASLLQKHLAAPDKILYRQWSGERWQDYSAGAIAALAARWQAAFRRAGLVRGERVALALRNSIHWVAIDQAALGLGLVVVPLYPNDNAENIAWCLKDSATRLFVTESERQAQALVAVLAGPTIVVCLNGEPAAPIVAVRDWLPDADLPFEIRPAGPGQLATLVYTSGTTGRPKGVMLSHENILSNVGAVLQIIRLNPDDALLSILPLAHMFERTCGYYCPLSAGVKVTYSRSLNLLADDLASQQPTLLIGVPRIFERFLLRIEQKLADAPFKSALVKLTVLLGWRCFENRAYLAERLLYRLLRPRIAPPILKRLGGKLRLAVVGGAPIEHRVSHFFIGLGLNLIQGYGLTETSPVVSANPPDDNVPDSVGLPVSGVTVRLNEKNELLVRSPGVMQAYWNNPAATAEVLLEDGWLNTGDLAEVTAGRIYIRGRSKDILVLSNGEKLSPQDAEIAILDDPLFEQAMLVGEGRPYPILLAVSAERNEKTLLRHANAQLAHLPRYQKVRRVIACPEAWTMENGLLTTTQKVKRDAVCECYRLAIEQAYRER